TAATAGAVSSGKEADGETRVEGDASSAPQQQVALPSTAANVVRPGGVSTQGAGKVLLKAFLVLVLLALLCGAVVVVSDTVVVVCLAVAGPALTQPIY
ncbi:unnamed protein product, partial [Scytosiphon promiscuus]